MMCRKHVCNNSPPPCWANAQLGQAPMAVDETVDIPAVLAAGKPVWGRREVGRGWNWVEERSWPVRGLDLVVAGDKPHCEWQGFPWGTNVSFSQTILSPLLLWEVGRSGLDCLSFGPHRETFMFRNDVQADSRPLIILNTLGYKSRYLCFNWNETV